MTAMMTIDEVVRDIHALEADLENYERKYVIALRSIVGKRLTFKEVTGKTETVAATTI